MARIVWLTDLHLDFVDAECRRRLAAEVRAERADAVLVGGDTGEAKNWAAFLGELLDLAKCPVHFVLGNHDFYRSSIASVRAEAMALPKNAESPQWLPRSGVVRLGAETVLVGHDGWGDATTPEFRTSDVVLNDYLMIEELRAASGADRLSADFHGEEGISLLSPQLQETLQSLGAESGDHFRAVLPEAAEMAKNIVVLMHVPPFREACWFQGRISDDNWAPHFTCVGAGIALSEFMTAHPEHRMQVLCGHTHNAGTARILPNLIVETGGAAYGAPAIQRAWDVA